MLSDEKEARQKLGRKLTLVLLPLVLIPALLIAGIAYGNTQSELEHRTNEQLETALQGQLSVLNAFVLEQENLLTQLVISSALREKLISALGDPQNNDAALLLNNELKLLQSSLGSTNSAGLFILNMINGKVLFSTDDQFVGDAFVFEPQILFQTVPLANDLRFASNSITFLSVLSLQLENSIEGNFALANISSARRVEQLAATMHTFVSNDADEPTAAITSFISVRPDIYLRHNVNEPPFVTLNTNVEPVFAALDPSDRVRYLFKNDQGEEIFVIAQWSAATDIALGIESATGNLFSTNSSTASILVISIILVTTIAVLAILGVTNRMLQPLSSLTELARRMTQGDWNFRVAEDRDDELGYLAKSLNQMARELGALYESMERRVEDRTKQIRIASEVARAVLSIPNLDELLRQAVNLIKDRFGYDHVSIFLIDKEGNNVVLRESSSEEKEALKTVGYKLKIGSPSMVGMVTESNEPKILSGTNNEPEITMDELLPGARSEVAIPLQLAGNSLGALAIQSYSRDAFKTEDIEVLQTLADQLSAAIENARLAQVSTNAAERARLVSEITSQISGLSDPGQVLHTTAKALHKALGEAEIIINLVSLSDDIEDIA